MLTAAQDLNLAVRFGLEPALLPATAAVTALAVGNAVLLAVWNQ